MIFELDILNDDQLNLIYSKYQYLNFEDGKKSNNTLIKQNKTVYDGQVYEKLVHYLYEILYKKIKDRYLIAKASQGYFSKYDEGDYYGWHFDDQPCGGIFHQYSMTLFLNDDYEGGELCLKFGDAIVEKKLKRGQALLYPSSLHHQVKPVLSGTRHVFICWLQSVIKDQFIREILHSMIDVDDMIDEQMLTEGLDKSDFMHDLRCKLYGIRCKIVGQHGTV